MTTITTTKAGRFIVFENYDLGKVMQTKGDFEPHILRIIGQIVRAGDLGSDLRNSARPKIVNILQILFSGPPIPEPIPLKIQFPINN
jgi:hypothetical protein